MHTPECLTQLEALLGTIEPGLGQDHNPRDWPLDSAMALKLHLGLEPTDDRLAHALGVLPVLCVVRDSDSDSVFLERFDLISGRKSRHGDRITTPEEQFARLAQFQPAELNDYYHPNEVHLWRINAALKDHPAGRQVLRLATEADLERGHCEWSEPR